MALYSTQPGICAIDKKSIPKTDAGGKGHKSPKPAHDEMSADSEGKVNHQYTFDALCTKHYLEAYAEVYPGADLPVL